MLAKNGKHIEREGELHREDCKVYVPLYSDKHCAGISLSTNFGCVECWPEIENIERKGELQTQTADRYF